MMLYPIAQQYHQWGANVTAIAAGEKRPAHPWKQWQDTRQEDRDVRALPWSRNLGGIGIINGVNGWHTYDIDAKKGEDKKPLGVISDATIDTLLTALGLPLDYAWVWRSGSGAGWAMAFRCDEHMPEGALTPDKRESGVFTGWPADSAASDWHHLELRWEHCQTVLPPSADGRGYAWRHTAPVAPPTDVSLRRVIAAFYTLAPPPPHTLGSIDRATLDAIKDRFDIAAFFEQALGGGVQHERDEIRILGHQGLLVNPEKHIWYIHGEQIGGDALDAVAYVTYRTTARNLNGKSAEILSTAAAFAGVTLPERKPTTSVVIDSTTGEIIDEPREVVKAAHAPTGPKKPLDVNDMLGLTFDPLRWFAPSFLREGLGLLVGQPNVGKTPLAIQLAIAIATGTKWMGHVLCRRSKVLYVGAEYSMRDIVPVLKESLGEQAVERDMLYIKTIEDDDFPQNADEAIAWLEYHILGLGIEVIIIDVMTAFLPPEKFKQNVYRGDYAELKPYHALGLRHHVGILGTWHGSKREADPRLMYNGSTGLWAAAASRMTLYTDQEGRVRISSFPRMGERIDWALAQEQIGRQRRWVVADANPTPVVSPTEGQVLQFLRETSDETNPVSETTIAEMAKIKFATVRTCLYRLQKLNYVHKVGSGWYAKTVTTKLETFETDETREADEHDETRETAHQDAVFQGSEFCFNDSEHQDAVFHVFQENADVSSKSFSIEGWQAEDREIWKLYDDTTDTVIGEYSSESEALDEVRRLKGEL